MQRMKMYEERDEVLLQLRCWGCEEGRAGWRVCIYLCRCLQRWPKAR